MMRARRALAIVLVALAFLALAPPAGEASGRWAWLGVRIRDLTEQEMNEISQRHGIREGFGVVIVEVMKETPAEASGLRSGDLVVGFGKDPVVDTRVLQRMIARAGVGETVALTVLRRNEGRRPVSVRLGVMPDGAAADRTAAEFGFVVRDPAMPPEPGAAPPSALPLVAAVIPRSGAEQAGMKVGDVLVEVNGRPVVTVEAAREALVGAALDRPLPVTVRRSGERLPLLLPSPLAGS